MAAVCAFTDSAFASSSAQVFLLAECEGRNDWRSQMFELLKGRYPGIMLTVGSQTDDLLNVRDSYQDAVFSRRMAQMKKLNAPIMSDNAHVREGQMVYPKQEIDALYNILRQKGRGKAFVYTGYAHVQPAHA